MTLIRAPSPAQRCLLLSGLRVYYDIFEGMGNNELQISFYITFIILALIHTSIYKLKSRSSEE